MNPINDISPINSINPINLSNPVENNQKVKSSNVLFEDFYNAAMETLKETNQYQIDYEKLQLDFAAGRTDDFIALTLAGEKASTSLNFTVQITNKVIEAYREIMRMQI